MSLAHAPCRQQTTRQLYIDARVPYGKSVGKLAELLATMRAPALARKLIVSADALGTQVPIVISVAGPLCGEASLSALALSPHGIGEESRLRVLQMTDAQLEALPALGEGLEGYFKQMTAFEESGSGM